MLNIFKIRKDERWLMVIATLFFSIMNAVTVAWYWTDFSRLTDNYHKLFVTKFHVSGFDPLTYEVISMGHSIQHLSPPVARILHVAILHDKQGSHLAYRRQLRHHTDGIDTHLLCFLFGIVCL